MQSSCPAATGFFPGNCRDNGGQSGGLEHLPGFVNGQKSHGGGGHRTPCMQKSQTLVCLASEYLVLMFCCIWNSLRSTMRQTFQGVGTAPPFHSCFPLLSSWPPSLFALMNFCHWSWCALPKWHFSTDVPRCLPSLPRSTYQWHMAQIACRLCFKNICQAADFFGIMPCGPGA